MLSGALVIPFDGDNAQIHVLAWGDDEDVNLYLVGWITRDEARGTGTLITINDRKCIVIDDVVDLLHGMDELNVLPTEGK
jgi:hypothetical protein